MSVISPLVTYKNISPSKNSREGTKIDTITIHCMAGHMTTKSCCDMFAVAANEVSVNYTVDDYGVIGCSVPEDERSWCSSSRSNDMRAVTIEVASDRDNPCNVTDKAYETLITLIVDICKRNGIKELKWKADESLIGQVDKQNITVHRWFAQYKACPGDYLYNRIGDIAAKVNKQLGAVSTKAPEPAPVETKVLYRVQVGAYGVKQNAENMLTKLKSEGYDAILVEVGTTTAPVAPKKSNAELAREVLDGKWGNGEDRKNRLRAEGYDPAAVQAEVNKLL